MLSICLKFDAADNKFDVKMVAPSLVEEVGTIFQFVIMYRI